jgi:hypothetical protein
MFLSRILLFLSMLFNDVLCIVSDRMNVEQLVEW